MKNWFLCPIHFSFKTFRSISFFYFQQFSTFYFSTVLFTTKLPIFVFINNLLLIFSVKNLTIFYKFIILRKMHVKLKTYVLYKQVSCRLRHRCFFFCQIARVVAILCQNANIKRFYAFKGFIKPKKEKLSFPSLYLKIRPFKWALGQSNS